MCARLEPGRLTNYVNVSVIGHLSRESTKIYAHVSPFVDEQKLVSAFRKILSSFLVKEGDFCDLMVYNDQSLMMVGDDYRPVEATFSFPLEKADIHWFAYRLLQSAHCHYFAWRVLDNAESRRRWFTLIIRLRIRKMNASLFDGGSLQQGSTAEEGSSDSECDLGVGCFEKAMAGA
jgi:hypothetical protein